MLSRTIGLVVPMKNCLDLFLLNGLSLPLKRNYLIQCQAFPWATSGGRVSGRCLYYVSVGILKLKAKFAFWLNSTMNYHVKFKIQHNEIYSFWYQLLINKNVSYQETLLKALTIQKRCSKKGSVFWLYEFSGIRIRPRSEKVNKNDINATDEVIVLKMRHELEMMGCESHPNRLAVRANSGRFNERQQRMI